MFRIASFAWGALVVFLSSAAWANPIINFDIGSVNLLTGGGLLTQTQYGSIDYNGDSAPDFWNNVGQSAHGGVDRGGVVDINGNLLAGVTIRADWIAGVVWGSSAFGDTMNKWGNAQGVPNDVIGSIYYGLPISPSFPTGQGPTLSFTVKGLTASAYKVEVFSAVSSNDPGTFGDRTLTIKANGLFANGSSSSATPLEGDGFMREAHGLTGKVPVLFSSVSPDANGWITVTVLDPGPGNPSVNALRLTAIPEPGTGSLLLLGVGIAAGLRRKMARSAA